MKQASSLIKPIHHALYLLQSEIADSTLGGSERRNTGSVSICPSRDGTFAAKLGRPFEQPSNSIAIELDLIV